MKKLDEYYKKLNNDLYQIRDCLYDVLIIINRDYSKEEVFELDFKNEFIKQYESFLGNIKNVEDYFKSENVTSIFLQKVDNISVDINSLVERILVELTKFVKSLEENPSQKTKMLKDFIEESLLDSYGSKLTNYMLALRRSVQHQKEMDLKHRLADFKDRSNELETNLNQVDNKLKQAENKLKQASDKLIDSNILDNQNKDHALVQVYFDAKKRYGDTALGFDLGFWGIIVFGVLIFWCLYCNNTVPLYQYPFTEIFVKQNNWVLILNYLLPKILVLTISITTMTFCLRRASHYRKLEDQANQTYLELVALPYFIKNLSSAEQNKIYKDLVGNYFGKTVDHTQNDKIADLIQDQAKMSIELAQSATEIVKSLKESTSSSSGEETKPNNDGK